MSSSPQVAGGDGVAERVLNVRKKSSGLQYEMQWRGQQATSWEAASRMRRHYPLLVQAFEQQQQQQQQQQSAEGATGGDEPMGDSGESPATPQQSSISAQEIEALQRLVREQAQQLRKQEEQHVATLQQVLASPAHFPAPSQLSPAQPSSQQAQHPPHIGTAGAAAAAPASRFAKKEPRAQDLREYDGASGAKLDEWRDELALASMLYELNSREAVTFAVSRLRSTALRWWLDELSSAERALIGDSTALVTALRGRFQHATAAYTARQQLDKLQQGSRGVNDFIADFQRIVAQIGLPSLGEENALFAFERGLRPNLAEKLREHGVKTLREAIAMAARVGSLQQAAAQPHGRGAAANQMDVDEGSGASSRLDRIEAALNALSANGGGMGAKTQTQRDYQQERNAGGRGGSRGGRGRGGRFGGRGGAADPPLIPKIPGVPAATVEQRRAAGQCYRCGSAEHSRFDCPNATSASGN